MVRVVVIGAGPMGLAAAHRAVALGYEVDLIEAGDKPGGMAAHFDFGGLSIERFYHFLCKSDEPTFALMRELGIEDKLRWMPTSMGYFIKGKMHPWGDPLALLTFPHLDFVSKIRLGLQMLLTTKRRNFAAIEHLTAHAWFEGGAGKRAYDTLWKRLLDLKFFELADTVSASWIATRVKRIGNSRKSIWQEELGYIDGGSETLVRAVVDAFIAKGGRLHLSTPVHEVEAENGQVKGVKCGDRFFAADAVIATVPMPFVSKLVPALPADLRAQYDSLKNIGVVCLLFKLKRSVSRNFWVNIVDPEIEIPGLIEFSNLRPVGETIIYVPYYMPATHPKWHWQDQQFIDEAFGYIRRVNTEIKADDLIEASVGRLPYAQPVCEPNFLDRLPSHQTPIKGLQIADTSFYYPEDRGIAESIRYGRMMAESL